MNGAAVVAALKQCGVSHLVWVPDSVLGAWEPDILAEPGLRLIRVCREGEAIALAGGLYLGGACPVAIVQCTGLFEAGDALRNLLHDLKLPLFFIIGVRSYRAHQQGGTSDNCPVFTEPIVQAWKLPYRVLDESHTAKDVADAYLATVAQKRAGAVLLAE